MFPTVKNAVKLHTAVHVGSGEDEEQNGGRRDCLDILVGMTLTFASATVSVLVHRVGDKSELRGHDPNMIDIQFILLVYGTSKRQFSTKPYPPGWPDR